MGRLSKLKWCLIGCIVIVLLFIIMSVIIPGKLINAVHWLSNSDFASSARTSFGHQLAKDDTLVEMNVDSVMFSGNPYTSVVNLKMKDGEIYFPIFIGTLEATAIVVILEEIEMPRPLTSDLIMSIMNMTGIRVSHIIIEDLQDGVYYATIVVDIYGVETVIDTRPSDAIAIALRAKVPIYVRQSVLDAAAILPEQDTW